MTNAMSSPVKIMECGEECYDVNVHSTIYPWRAVLNFLITILIKCHKVVLNIWGVKIMIMYAQKYIFFTSIPIFLK
jgi:hypothetical protein